ncbi:hypothetical protein SSABA_v1c04100 [Spiroplasma sabaudiense Ar-1343]|uniref:Uncharacterized protein n=1 Tax=Spiroplasma sabaudiense Ar-1343 TaxID=1276257 RepID=W6AJC5_9MOLU|nr:hypothetical protein [Spiroplasma sabaudiense]AHI53819.1 hypothetical protein SSABA_v1c04100 [Spiroplasma sabaudiense Ar-1343]
MNFGDVHAVKNQNDRIVSNIYDEITKKYESISPNAKIKVLDKTITYIRGPVGKINSLVQINDDWGKFELYKLLICDYEYDTINSRTFLDNSVNLIDWEVIEKSIKWVKSEIISRTQDKKTRYENVKTYEFDNFSEKDILKNDIDIFYIKPKVTLINKFCEFPNNLDKSFVDFLNQTTKIDLFNNTTINENVVLMFKFLEKLFSLL